VEASRKSKSWGKQRVVLSDSDNEELDSSGDFLVSRSTSPSESLSELLVIEVPPTGYASSSSSAASIAEASEGSELNRGVDSSLTQPSNLDADGSLTSRRSKRVRVERHISVQGDGACAEDGCEDPTNAQLKVQCAGPGCGLMVSDICFIS
jgi:hypothetical protein